MGRIEFVARKALYGPLYPLRVAIGRLIARGDTPIMHKAAQFVASNQVPGDYLEFGVYTGGSFASAFHSLRRAFEEYSAPGNTPQEANERRELWQQMRFVAFDSFEGLPAPTGIDTQTRNFVQGKFACSQSQFEKNIASAGVPLERTIVVPGWFAYTLTEATIRRHHLRHAAIVHIDSDLYESAKRALDFVTPLLVDGTVIIFDDWYAYRGNPYLGEQRAWREWCAAHPEWTTTEYHKQGASASSFLVNQAPMSPGGGNEGPPA